MTTAVPGACCQQSDVTGVCRFVRVLMLGGIAEAAGVRCKKNKLKKYRKKVDK